MRICTFSRIMGAHRDFYPSLVGVLTPVFSELGIEVVSLTTALPDGSPGRRQEGIADVHYLAPRRVDDSFCKATAAEFDRLHAEKPFDLVFGRGPSVWGFLSQSAHAATVPLIMHEGTYPRWLHQLDRKLPRLRGLLEKPFALMAARKHRIYRQCLQRAAVVVCNSPALAQALRRVNWWNPPNTRFIPYGFDLEPYIAADRPVEQPPRLVNVGRLTWDKGVIDMIDILASAKGDAVLEVIGPANSRVQKAMVARAAKHGVQARVTTPGPARNDDLPGRLSGASVYLFPSTHPEGLSKSVMEAMAAALPVVAYDMPGMRALIEDKVTGFILPAGDTAGAAAKVDLLLSDPGLRDRMGQAARARLARDFGHPSAIAQWQALFAEVKG
ncbi:glycosyltransferase family 4 protein [Tabrizicola sp.]|uniref:glycosyltransferase family 4 protein n=1 Tax=Tabrizicola sp. TaxID=2005166 RepID=UPI0035B19E68